MAPVTLSWRATLRELTTVLSGMGRVPDVGRRAGIAVKVAGMRKGPTFMGLGLLDLSGRLPTLPHTCACSTIGAEGLNFRVRDGNGWDPLAMVTQHLVVSSTEADATELVLLSLCCQELLAEYLNNRIFDGIRLPRLSVMLSAS